jgi:hypothetical protein
MLRIVVITLLACVQVLAQGGAVLAFHAGGPEECKECHEGRGPALHGSDAGSTCLRCHQAPQRTTTPRGHYVATHDLDLRAGVPPSQMTPGGDFSYLKKKYSWNTPGKSARTSEGDRHGHNIVALDFGFMPDSKNSTAPGGVYPAGSFSCVSCHDPHAKIARDAGNAGSYRMLGTIGYKPASGNTVFLHAAPVAVAPENYNRSEAATDTRVAYGEGMSEWCSNCHARIGEDAGATGYGHPVGHRAKFTMNTGANYDAYVKSGSLQGSRDTSFSSLVPFEEGNGDRLLLAQHAKSNGTYLKGPDLNAQITCLSCHRAHASGWDFIARWNMGSTFIVHKGVFPGSDNGAPAEYAQGRTARETQRALYDRPVTRFAEYQRGLCNKCHARD